MRSKSLNLNSDCTEGKRGYSCSILISDIDDFDGEQIQYYFNLTDILGKSDQSKPVSLEVDTKYPIINSITYTKSGTKVDLSVNITELNFDLAEYIDNSDPRASWRMLCTNLVDGICKKSIVLRSGSHSLDIQVTDEAGNSVAQNIVINI